MKRNELYKNKLKYWKISTTRIIQFSVLFTISLFIIPFNSLGQHNKSIQANDSIAEKVYLQLDRKVYTTGNIIWYKAIVINGFSHIPSSLSSVLYVELIDQNKAILEKKIIKIKDGIGQGFFHLHKTYGEGRYLLRAYTNWNKNFGNEFFFKEYIQVFAPKEADQEIKPIENVKLIKEQSNKNRLEAYFYPLEIDKSHKNKLKIFVTLDDKVDSLYIKKGKGNVYKLDYDVTDESQFAILQMETANHKKYTTTIAINKEYIDLQFLPESGELVHGLPGKIGFKALDANGQGKFVQGNIVDEKDSVITSFKSNSLGMGSFVLNKADTTRNYYAQLLSESDKNSNILYPLPKVASSGNILSIKKQGEKVVLSALSNYLVNDSIYLNFSFRGLDFHKMRVGLQEGIQRFSLLRENLPEGIISCVMMDNSMRPLAERLFFNEKPESRIKIDLTPHKNIYAKRKLTKLEIAATNSEGKPVDANLSLLVINKKQLGEIQSRRQNILSYFLLDSELKGEIENPGFYFREDSSMHFHLDALMLTQGWRKYNYYNKPPTILFPPETNLTVSGQVSSAFSAKKKRQAEISMFTFGENKSIYSQVTDSLGKFSFNLNEEYGQNINALIQSSKKTGERKDYTITLDKKESPPVVFSHHNVVEKLDSVVQVFVEKDMERNKIDDAFPLPSENILIDEVEITAYRLTPQRKKVIKRYGKPKVVISGKSLKEKEEKWSFGLFSVLMFHHSDKIRIVKYKDELHARVIGAPSFGPGDGVTLVVIDGITVKAEDYSLLAGIPVSEIESFEIIQSARNFLHLYLETVPGAPIMESPRIGSVIAIYTHTGKGLFGIKRPVGIMQTSLPVFSAPREFYAPKYENLKPEDLRKPDLRALIHWEPELRTDSLGQASASFYNADNIGKMVMVLEAITKNGEIGYKEVEYEIAGKEIIIVN